jgi:hypothetical protein
VTHPWSWKQWLAVILVTVATWTGLNLGRVLYQDWAFVHAIRLATEAQAAAARK